MKHNKIGVFPRIEYKKCVKNLIKKHIWLSEPSPKFIDCIPLEVITEIKSLFHKAVELLTEKNKGTPELIAAMKAIANFDVTAKEP